MTAHDIDHVATVRQATGDPLRFFAYVESRSKGRVVKTCAHAHRRRGKQSGAVFARRCAEKMRREIARAR